MRVLVLVMLLIGSAASAQPALDAPGWRIGSFSSFGTSIYRGEGTSLTLLPVVYYQGDGFSIGVDEVSLQAYDSEDVTISALLRPRFEGLLDPEGDYLAGIDREITVDAALEADVSLGENTSLGVELRSEVTGEHGGQEVLIGVSQTVFAGPVPLFLSADVSWQSEDLAAYLYGVRDDEARADRPAYDPGAVLIPSVSVGTGYPFTDRLLLFGQLGVDVMPDAVTDSPIVEESVRSRLSLGLTYRF